jgi:hypothetical protein
MTSNVIKAKAMGYFRKANKKYRRFMGMENYFQKRPKGKCGLFIWDAGSGIIVISGKTEL